MSHRSFLANLIPLVLLCGWVSAVPASAAGRFDGIYVNSDGGNVAYFQIVEDAGAVTGSYVVVVRNTNSEAGLDQSRFTVTGSTDDRHALLRLAYDTPAFQAPLSYRWIARSNASGFTLELPLGNGGIAQMKFHRAGVAQLDALVATMSTVAEGIRRVRAAHVELANAEATLHKNVIERLGDLHAIADTQAAFDAAEARKHDAELAVLDLRQEADLRRMQASRKPPGAFASELRGVQTDLEDQANYADYAADSAKEDVKAADDQIALSEHALDSIKEVLAEREVRIARLKSMIARDAGLISAAAVPLDLNVR
jgi:hypothetical protein